MTTRTDAGRIAELEARFVAEAVAELVVFREGTKRDLKGMQPGEFRDWMRDTLDECEMTLQEIVMNSAGDGVGQARH
jgi:hypothetical protein